MSELNKDLKNIALGWAEKIVQDMYAATHDPSYKIDGDTLQLYKELTEWGWFDMCPFKNTKGEEITIIMLAIRKYGKLKWQKGHPPKKKPSKWEIVTGKAPKK